MFRKVLVPLDGSDLAERALPHVKNLAKKDSVGEVVLLTVIEIPPVWLSSESFDILAFKNMQYTEAQKYLVDLQSRMGLKGINVKIEILEGKAAQSIVQYANENAVDLIVIGTHGYTGMKELVLGSVALRVLHDAHTPVLLIKE